jgi:fibronectin-binding autotransporter adhesin
LILANDTSLRDLTVGNGGAGDANVALLATAGMTRTLVADVTARAQGDGSNNYTVVLSGSGTGVTLQQVTALAENGSGNNAGLLNLGGAAVVLRGGSFTARGGVNAWGINSANSATTLEAVDVTALGENGSNLNYGLLSRDGAAATLRGGAFTGRGGSIQAEGVGNTLGSTLTAEGITALGENGGDNYGLGNYNSAAATLYGGSFTARGGAPGYNYTIAISNEFNGSTLEAEGVTALAENGSNGNYGLFNVDGAATVRGGSFSARGGTDAYGIYNANSSNTTLETESVTALGENASSNNYGLSNSNGFTATLHGGSFTGRGGTFAYGISTSGSDTTLEAENVTALGEDGSSGSYSLFSFSGAAVVLRGGAFTGRGGTYAYGIATNGSDTTLEAESVTALAENGSSGNYGLYNDGSATANATQSVLEGATNSVYRDSGSVTVSNGRLAGGAVNGTVTCVLVTRGTTISTDGSTCP